jgi:hypothetical protein
MPVIIPGDEPFPIVDRDPSISKCLKSFRTSDWTFVAGATAACTVIGYYMGRNTHTHRGTALVAGFTGVLFGVSFSWQNSLYRQLGLRENAAELEASRMQ